ncbi:MAG: helix-turn-helix transcriptional regulator [Kiritimatiellae bacterium]|nr:helix-turn-helix transcriptional regulator [Kiritimatiellia bacterium]
MKVNLSVEQGQCNHIYVLYILLWCVDCHAHSWCAKNVKSRKPIPSYRKKIGYAIRVRREAIGISQERMSEVADCHRNYIGLIERGEQNLTVGSLVRVAQALKCKASDLLSQAGL